MVRADRFFEDLKERVESYQCPKCRIKFSVDQARRKIEVGLKPICLRCGEELRPVGKESGPAQNLEEE